MIDKECQPPIRLQKLAVLNGRIADNHAKKYEISTDFHNRKTGYEGEKAVFFYLEALSNTKYHIFHDLRLLLGKYYFQIDILILSAAYLLILEVKNRARDWYFDNDFNQATYFHNGKKERTINPVLQARLQALKLKKWLQCQNIMDIPIHYRFVNSNEKANIFCKPGNKYFHHMCNSEQLLDKVELIDNQYKTDSWDEKEVRKVKRLLLSKHTPDDIDILKHYHLSPHDLLNGVRCPNHPCSFLPMAYRRGTWRCPKCGTMSKTAHIATIQDYFLLNKPSITNAEARKILQINSSKVSHTLLASMDLTVTGTFRNREYHPKALKIFSTLMNKNGESVEK